MTDLLKRIRQHFENDDAYEYIEKLCRVIEEQDVALKEFAKMKWETVTPQTARAARAEARRLLE